MYFDELFVALYYAPQTNKIYLYFPGDKKSPEFLEHSYINLDDPSGFSFSTLRWISFGPPPKELELIDPYFCRKQDL